MSNLPVIDDLYVRHVFDSLSSMQVELDGDPLVFGPKRLNAKVAQCRDYLSKCQQIYLQLSDHRHQLSRASRQAKLDFDIKAQDLLANDPEVKSQRAIRDREAVVSSKLRVERETNHIIETAITDLESVIMVVKAKREDLKDIQGRIRDQVKLCQEEIGLGSMWGSAPPPGTRVDLGARPRVDTRTLGHQNEVLEDAFSITDLVDFVRDETGSVGNTVSQDLSNPDLGAVLEKTVEQKVVVPEVADTKDADPFVLSEITSVDAASDPTSSISSISEVEDFLNALDVEDSATKPSAPLSPPPSVEDLDIDDLLGALAS